MEAPLTPGRALMQMVRDWVPIAKREYEDTTRETVQSTVWIVTLATALLTFAALNDKLLARLAPASGQWLIGLLLASVAFGVVQRITQHIVDQLLRRHLLELHNHLVGAALEPVIPPSPESLITRDLIVAALQDYFHLDYGFLHTYDVALADCQGAYRSQYEVWLTQERQLATATVELLAAYTGKPSTWGHNLLQPTDAKRLDHIRRHAKKLIGAGWLALGLFAATAISFVSAIAILGGALIHRLAS